MTRTVSINGKTVTLESGLTPEPTPFGKRGRPKSDFRLLLEAMRDGESVFLPTGGEKIKSTYLYKVGQKIGARFSYRSEKDGIRIYRMAEQPAPVMQAVKNGAKATRISNILSAWN